MVNTMYYNSYVEKIDFFDMNMRPKEVEAGLMSHR